MPKLLITKNSSNNKKLQIINAQAFIRDSTYIRNTVLPILRSSITNFYNYIYDGGSAHIDDGGSDMYDFGNVVYLNGTIQLYDTESANTFCYRSYPFIYKTTQTSNFTLSVQGNYGSDGGETKYQYQQDFDYQGRKFSIYISESTDLSDPSIVECFIVYYPNTKPTINFTYTESGDDNGNETIDVSNLNGQSITAFYLLISNYSEVQIGSATLFDALKTFVVNATSVSTYNSIGKKLKISKINTSINYSNGLYGKRYLSYFDDDVNWFNTATLHGDVNQLTEINGFTSDDDYYSWQWVGYFKASSTENYTFYTSSDDASYLWIGSNALAGFTTANANVNNGGLHGPDEAQSSPISLTAGVYYPIRIQFGENEGGDEMSFSFSTPTIAQRSDGLGYYYYNPATNGF